MKLSEFLKKVDGLTNRVARNLKSHIRELEEESSGRFVAFVDDGKVSYDVSVTLDIKSLELKESTCDCDQGSLCGHIVAVMSQLNEGRAKTIVSQTIKRLKKKKLTEPEKLIVELEESRIISWLTEELNSDSELFIKFKNHFNAQNLDISPKAIQANYKECYKAVNGKKRLLGLSELPKLLKLLVLYDDKVIDATKHQMGDGDSIKAVYEIQKVYEDIEDRLKKNTTRIKTYLKKFNAKVEAGFGVLDAQQFNELIKTSSIFYNLDLDLVILVIMTNNEALDDKSKVAVCENLLAKSLSHSYITSKEWQKVLNVVYDLGLFEKYYTNFPLFHWEHDYNVTLLTMAEEYSLVDYVMVSCENLINQNKDYYCLPYIKILRSIFQKADNKKYLTSVLKYGFEVCPDYEGFIMLYEKSSKTSDKVALVKKVNSLRLDSYQKAYMARLELKFGVWNYLGNYDKIMSKIKNYSSFWEATKYEEELLKYDKLSYLKVMISCDDLDWDLSKLNKCLPHLEQLVKKHYSEEDLAIVRGNVRLYSEELKAVIGG